MNSSHENQKNSSHVEGTFDAGDDDSDSKKHHYDTVHQGQNISSHKLRFLAFQFQKVIKKLVFKKLGEIFLCLIQIIMYMITGVKTITPHHSLDT